MTASNADRSAPFMRDVWFDWFMRKWVVQKKDREGNQIGEAAYFHSRKEAEQMVKEAK
jgi:hypothetical protein